MAGHMLLVDKSPCSDGLAIVTIVRLMTTEGKILCFKLKGRTPEVTPAELLMRPLFRYPTMGRRVGRRAST